MLTVKSLWGLRRDVRSERLVKKFDSCWDFTLTKELDETFSKSSKLKTVIQILGVSCVDVYFRFLFIFPLSSKTVPRLRRLEVYPLLWTTLL